ncbi:tetratricopeptide repeat protein 7B [Thrips palmi]|uniref:Tetratricopeptide repeat protein 7B n=1 Tax=Thrips palmi TaxID=161013 RepID=A0A6P9A7B5_THRPL|nr:tetratricopeptide repeat protein 7B [Thrips palmi]
MAGKGKANVRIENEIEKSREESDWKRLIELAEQLKARSPNHDCLANFLIGEGKLESFLEEVPPLEANVAKARFGLIEVKRFLNVAVTKQPDESLDANLLLGKLNYAMGYYDAALQHYNAAKLQSLSEKPLFLRSLRIVAESFAIKGMCLEKVPPSSSSKYKQAEWEEQMLQCYQTGGDLALLYLQDVDKLNQQGTMATSGSHSPQPPNPQKQIGPILENAIQRSPLLYIKVGKTQQAVNRYRAVLSAVESSSTQALRLVLTRRLAEVILRGVSPAEYTCPTNTSEPSYRRGLPAASKTDSPWKPKKYGGHNLFVPRNENEEIILLLLISESMAVREAVLSQSPEFKEVRIRAYGNASAVYDLLTVALVRWGQVDLLTESFERAMKFSANEPMAWLQHALCLITAGKHAHGLSVLREATILDPASVSPCLVAARACYETLNLIPEGLEWSQKALERELTRPQHLESRCYLYFGIGYSLQAANTHLRKEKEELNSKALQSFARAHHIDPNDHLSEYYLALQKANACKVQEAIRHVKSALQLRADHVPSLHLLVLLLSAQKQHQEALSLVHAILEEYPDNLNIMYVQAHLELEVHGGECALLTGKKMLAIWKNLYEDQTSNESLDQSERRSETRSVFNLYHSGMSDKDSSSLHAHSLAASRVEQALSEVASTLSSFTPRPGPHRSWMLQLHVWLLLAEIYLSMDQPSSAILCIQEATNIFALSHHIMYTRGLLHEHKQEFVEAKLCYQNALAIHPTHIKSMQHLGLVYHYLGSHRIAEKTLRDAARIDPTSYLTWYNLGKVLESLEEFDTATDCMATALETETTSPILPYSTIPLTFD